MRMIRPARHDFSLDLVRALRVLTLAALVMALALGCGSDPAPTGPVGPQGCPTGSVLWTDGSCMPVGIQGCADIFIEEDGLCHPRMAKCPAGTIPKFDEGCVPVGIQGCAEMFMEEDGLCHPSITKCPAGTIPKFDEGCVPVGIQGCAEVFMEDDGLCHPTMEKCPAGTFAVPQEGCVPIDGPDGCGTGTWGNLQEVAGVTTIWVDPSVAASGNGTMASPVKTIAEAMVLVPVGGRVALGAGTYDEPIHITKTVTIEGRCPSMVRVQGTGTLQTLAYVVWVDATDNVTLRSLEIGGAGIGVLVSNATGLKIEGFHVRSATTVGVLLEGSTTEASISRSWIDGTLGQSDGVFGRGVNVAYGATVAITESAVIVNREIGVFAAQLGTEITLTDSLVEGTLPREGDGQFGRGTSVQEGAMMTLASTAVIGNHETGAVALNDGTSLSISDGIIEGTLPGQASGAWGSGIQGIGGAALTILRTAILDNRHVGVMIGGTETQATATGTLIAHTLPQQSDGTFGDGAFVQEGAKLTLRGSAIVANSYIGLVAIGAESEIAAAGVLVEGQGERGIEGNLGALISLNGCAVIENHYAGIAAAHEHTELTATDSLVAGTLPAAGEIQSGRGVAIFEGARTSLEANAIVLSRSSGVTVQSAGTEVIAMGNLIASASERGVSVDRGATLTLDGNVILQNNDLGLYAGDHGTTLMATRNLVEGTLPDMNDRRGGRGVGVESSARMTFEGNAVIDNRDVGLMALGDGSSVIATHNLIEGTLPRESDGQYGEGVACVARATLQLASSIINNNRGIALHVDAGTAAVSRSLIDVVLMGSFTLNDGMVSGVSTGDGLMATLDSTLDVTDTRIQGCVRAGVLFEDSSGTLSGVTSTENQFGLVLQGERRPSYENGNNQFTANTGQDIVLGGDLPVPDAPSPVPPAPPPPSP